MTTSVPQTKPPRGGGWLPWLDPYGRMDANPYDYVEVETWREGWTETGLQEPGGNPYQNVCGLWWRPAGPRLTAEARLARAVAWMLFPRR